MTASLYWQQRWGISKPCHGIHAFLVDLSIQGSHHTLLIESNLSIGIVGYVVTEWSCEFTSHCLYYRISSAAVPFMSPRLEVDHGIRLAVGNHHYLYMIIYTLRPDPPARTTSPLILLRKLYYAVDRRVLLVATRRGLFPAGCCLVCQFLPSKSNVYFSCTDPSVTTG